MLLSDRFFLFSWFFLFSQQFYAQHSLVKLNYPVNSDNLDEICPVVSYDQAILYFTRVGDVHCEKTLFIDSFDVYKTLDEDQYREKLKFVYSQIASEPVHDPLSSSYNQDIWFAFIKGDQTEGIYHPGFPINDVLPNSICSNYGKTNTYLVINQFAPYGGIEKGFSYTVKTEENFSFPQPVFIKNFNQKGSDINITASLDSSVLILATQLPDSTKDMDLSVCFRMSDNNYSQPISLGPDINTPFRESTPMLTHDGKRLFFTSDRPGGWGGKDIYYADKKDFTYTSWSVPVKLNPPVNSFFDDSHPHLMRDNNVIYFTSNRDGTSDIFHAKLLRENLQKEITININIISSETNKRSPGELYWGTAYTSKRDGYFRSKDGLCRYKFFENIPIVFKAVNRNLQSDEIVIDPQELVNKGISVYTLDLIMYPDGRVARKENAEEKGSKAKPNEITETELNKTIMLDNIYFERTKPEVLPESNPSLQRLAEVLLARPLLYIKIIGHTDNVGDTEALKKLSEDRAKAIKAILVQKGVPEFRVSTEGFGASKPIAPNDTEENKRKNRRVEIKIVSQ